MNDSQKCSDGQHFWYLGNLSKHELNIRKENQENRKNRWPYRQQDGVHLEELVMQSCLLCWQTGLDYPSQGTGIGNEE